LREGGHFIVVASGFGSLRHLDARLHGKFDTEKLSLEDIERTMDDYVASFKSGRARAEHWPDSMNTVSKIAQVASARILARDMKEQAQRRGLLINALCPGLVYTEASRPWFDDMSKAQTSAHAAIDMVWLALQQAGPDAPYGQLVQKRKLIPWR